MTPQDAHDLLDAARDGANFSEREIIDALRATGDIEIDDYPTVRCVPVGGWERQHQGLAPAQWFEVAT